MTVEPPQDRLLDPDGPQSHDITVVLNQAVGGDVAARDRLYKLLYELP